jgi:quinol monooxygenase YgiN
MSEVKAVKDFIASQHMQDAFKRVNAMSTAPMEFIWLEELAP